MAALTIKEVSELPIGSKVYKVTNRLLLSFITAGFSPFARNYYMLCRTDDATRIDGVYVHTDNNLYYTDYAEACIDHIEQVRLSYENVKKIYGKEDNS